MRYGGGLGGVIGVIGMGVWAHHMFVVGMGSTPNAFFAASTMLVAVPTGVKIFNWLGTIYGGRLRFETPMLFCLAFLFQFLCAGLTGIMLAVAPFDWQLSDSYFVVAHFHFVLIGGLVFTIFAAIYYWFPKATGRMLSETLGRWHFWLFVIGFNLTFIPLHFAGVLGMPRRIYTYPADRGWDVWNLVATLGVPIQGAALLLFLINVDSLVAPGQTRRQRPMGCLDARVVDDVATPRLQLRNDSRGQEPSAAVGPQASRVTRIGCTNKGMPMPSVLNPEFCQATGVSCRVDALV